MDDRRAKSGRWTTHCGGAAGQEVWPRSASSTLRGWPLAERSVPHRGRLVVTLDRLVNVLGGYGVRPRFCAVPRSTELRTVVMHEDAHGRVVVGDVLLAIGARSVEEAVRWAVAARAVAVLIRDGEDTTFRR